MNTTKNISPWFWIPTLYFAEGLPYFIVNQISVIMFNRMGVPNDQMAFFTSLIYLPWVIKPLWSPFVDVIKTKRWWIISMQILMSIALVLTMLSIPSPTQEMIEGQTTPISLFTFTLILFLITAFFSATHDIAADGFYMLALNHNQQSVFVGIRNTFYRISSVFTQGVLVVIAGYFTEIFGTSKGWSFTIGVTALIFCLITIYHSLVFPKNVEKIRIADGIGREDEPKSFSILLHELAESVKTFIFKPGIGTALIFLLFYRLPEALLLKMISPFMMDSNVGLGLSEKVYGVVYGTIGLISLMVGGIVGGLSASKWGLKKMFWPMAALLALPCAVYVYFAFCHPSNLIIITLCAAFEQFGYGFGFTAYTLFMIYFSEGEFKTSHYAICTAFMALGVMLPGMVAGKLQIWLGYNNFFILVMVACLATAFATLLVYNKIDPKFGKK